MSVQRKFSIEPLLSHLKTCSRAQLGAVIGGFSLAAASAVYFSPFLRKRMVSVKEWFLSLIYGTKEQRMLNYVLANAKKGDADSVINTIDAFCWSTQWMMNVGDVKGLIVDEQLDKVKPMVAVELGGYCGYSAVRIGRKLPEGASFYSIEVNPTYAEIARQVIEFAGLKHRCQVLVGDSKEVLASFAKQTGHNKIDFLFIDHWKDLYVRDIKVVQELDLLRKGSVVVADNVVYPGAPDYLVHIRSNPKFSSVFYQSTLEYCNELDGIEISTYEG